MNSLETPFGTVQLLRYPEVARRRDLRAWDAADEYLLHHAYSEHAHLLGERQPLVVNDEYGALACSLLQYNPISWGDSYTSHLAAEENVAANSLAGKLTALDSLSTPAGIFKLVLLKIPRTVALLEHQLAVLKPHLEQDSVLVGAGMLKYMPASVFRAFERYIGPVKTSLARKKARLIHCSPDTSIPAQGSPYPVSYQTDCLDIPLSSHANVFSRNRIDNGTRFLLSKLENMSAPVDQVIDLACGNGILGLCLQRRFSDAQVLFTDASYMAVASARDNYRRLIPDPQASAQFQVQFALQNQKSATADLIVCNPPFHEAHAVADNVARSLFVDAHRCLRSGQLWVVANNHLGYKSVLQKLFGNCRVVASDGRYVVLCANR
ncbi:MAG: methyltransferase [Granulosicoccus sp.]